MGTGTPLLASLADAELAAVLLAGKVRQYPRYASLGREGTARAHAGSEGLLRITKTWRFSGHAPVLSVDYLLGNRSRDPVRARFGVTLTVNVDGQLGASRVVRLPGGRPLPFDHAFEQDDVGRFGLVFADLGFELQLRATPAVTLLAYPVRVGRFQDPVTGIENMSGDRSHVL